MSASPWAVAGFFAVFALASGIGLTPTSPSTLAILVLRYAVAWLAGSYLLDRFVWAPRWGRQQQALKTTEEAPDESR
jgi:predicted cobalt transporter CbtA